jgi:cytoskeletal protein RodZ
MTKSGFGEHLKREREMRGVSLDEICAATRIATRFLEALENEDWGQLPGGVFNRGFVRAVARFLGLDEESFVAEYMLATSEQNPTPEWAKPQPASVPAPTTNHLRWVGLLLGVLLLSGGAWGWRSYASRRAERRAAEISAQAAEPADTQAAAAASETSPATDNPDTDAPAAAVPSPQDSMLQLKIEAGKGTTLKVSADGSKVFDGSMIAGQSRDFTALVDFEVQVKDAGALLLELNGQMLAPIGPPGHSGRVTLTRADLKSGGGAH